MTSRATPPIVPTFGDLYGNQPYTMVFDNVMPPLEKKNVNKVKEEGGGGGGGGGGVLQESQSKKKATNFVFKKTSNQYAKSASDEKGLHDGHLKHFKAKEHMDMKSVNGTSNESSIEKQNNSTQKSTSSQYQGRLGNPLSSHPPRPSENTVQPTNMRHGSARSLPYENHAEDMKFGAWKENPEVPITIVFENIVKRGKEERMSLHSYSDGGRHETPSHKRISNDYKNSLLWWSRFNPKKWWKRLFG